MTRHVALLLIAASSLAACSVRSNNSDADADDNVSIKADESGNVSFNLPFARGEVKLPEGSLKNGDFDIDGVKMIPGGTVSGFNLDSTDNGSVVKMNFAAPKSPDEVRAYFVDQFKQKGIEAARAGDAVSGKAKDGSPFVIHVASAPQGSKGTIEVQSKD